MKLKLNDFINLHCRTALRPSLQYYLLLYICDAETHFQCERGFWLLHILILLIIIISCVFCFAFVGIAFIEHWASLFKVDRISNIYLLLVRIYFKFFNMKFNISFSLHWKRRWKTKERRNNNINNPEKKKTKQKKHSLKFYNPRTMRALFAFLFAVSERVSILRFSWYIAECIDWNCIIFWQWRSDGVRHRLTHTHTLTPHRTTIAITFILWCSFSLEATKSKTLIFDTIQLFSKWEILCVPKYQCSYYTPCQIQSTYPKRMKKKCAPWTLKNFSFSSIFPFLCAWIKRMEQNNSEK